jgi:predicted nucleic acid-binding protein
MIHYLLDTNVVSQPSKANPDANALAWLDATDDVELAISAVTVHELWYGVARARAANHPKAEVMAAAVDAILDAYTGRILPIETQAAKVWAELLAKQNKHVNDKCLVAVARVNNLTLVTRNVSDTTGLGVDVLNPFKKPAQLHTSAPPKLAPTSVLPP